MVVHVVAERERIVTVVDRLLARQVLGVERSSHAGVRHHWLLSVTMVEVSVLEELDAVLVKDVILSLGGLECSQVFRLASETAVAWLEMRASDVTHGHLIEALVDFASSLGGVLELDFGGDCAVEVIVTGNLD